MSTPKGSEPVRQGQIRAFLDVAGNPTATRVVVVSSDEVNEGSEPLVVPLIRGQQEAPPFLIALPEHDPHAGRVDVAHLSWQPVRFLGDVVGIVSGTGMERIRAAIAELVRG